MQAEQSYAVRHTTPFVSRQANNATLSYLPPREGASRNVGATALLNLAMGFDASVIEPHEFETEQLADMVMMAWTQYHEVGMMLARSVRALRNRMSIDQYVQLLETMPGFTI